jgi:formate/nitrite transporter
MNQPQQYHPSLSHKDVTHAISKLGVSKANTKIWQLFLLGILAGLYIGFGGQLFLVTVAAGLGKILGGVMFSVGLVLVVIAGAELFTGNLTILIGVFSGIIPKRRMLRNWLTVYLGNFVGSVVFAIGMNQTGLFHNAGNLNTLGALAVKVAQYKLAIPFTEAFIRAIFCNMLVILAIIMAIMAKDIVSKILAIILPITCFVACGFEHCIANMYLITLGMLLEGTALHQIHPMVENLLPVTLGNIVGGILILVLHPSRISQIGMLLKRKKARVSE